MKYCEKCGNELLDEAILCPKCGCMVRGNEKVQTKKEETVKKTVEENQTLKNVIIVDFISNVLLCICVFLSAMNFFFTDVHIWQFTNYIHGSIEPEKGIVIGLLIAAVFCCITSSISFAMYSKVENKKLEKTLSFVTKMILGFAIVMATIVMLTTE